MIQISSPENRLKFDELIDPLVRARNVNLPAEDDLVGRLFAGAYPKKNLSRKVISGIFQGGGMGGGTMPTAKVSDDRGGTFHSESHLRGGRSDEARPRFAAKNYGRLLSDRSTLGEGDVRDL